MAQGLHDYEHKRLTTFCFIIVLLHLITIQKSPSVPLLNPTSQPVKDKGKETLFIHGIQFKAGSLWGRVGEMNVGFWREGKTGVPREKPPRSRKENQQTQPT